MPARASSPSPGPGGLRARLRARRPGGDAGNALVEFTYLAVLLMVPLVYVLVAVFQVQRAAFGVTEAARQAGRAYATADDPGTGLSRAQTAARLAFGDQVTAAEGTIGLGSGITVSAPDGVRPGSRVVVSVTHLVTLPGVGDFFPPGRAGIPVTGRHIEVVDCFKAGGGPPVPACLGGGG